MRKLNYHIRKLNIIYLSLIFLTLIHFIFSFNVSSLKVNYFEEKKKLFYINPLNNYKGDLYFEYWGEGSDNTRYFTGINVTTGEEIYFGKEKIKKVEASESHYHTSIIINEAGSDNDHIFSINIKKYYLEFVNLENGAYSYKTINDLFNIKVKEKPSYRNSIIKLKNGYYLLSFILKRSNGIPQHNLFLQLFSFNSYNMEGINIIKKKNSSPINSLNSSQCFQTEKNYLQCSYSEISFNSYYSIGVYDLNFEKKGNDNIGSNPDIFNYMLHVKNEIGAYIYFNSQETIPIIKIRQLSDNLNKFIDLYQITLNFNNAFTFNNGLFYSDAIKINDDKFAVILTSKDLFNIIVCLFDLYNNNKNLRLRYYNLEVRQINIQISVNIKAFKFGNLLGISFYNSLSEYAGYFLFNYPIFKYDNNFNYINSTAIEIKLFSNSSSYSFSLSENIQLINNVFGVEIIGIKIINFPDKISSGITIKASNTLITKNFEIDINDQLIFEPFLTGAIPGKYILNFSIILKESTNPKSFSDLIKYYYYQSTNANYQPKTFIGNVLKLIFTVECKDECKTCNQLNNNLNYYCVKCKEEFPYFFSENSACKSECNDSIIINGDTKYCINFDNKNNIIKGNCEKDQLIYKQNGTILCNDNCEEGQFIYELVNEKYCIDICENIQFVYINGKNKTYCFDNCYDNQTITINNSIKYCNDYCNIYDKFIYINKENEKYCKDNCGNDTYLYIGEHNEKYCYDQCKRTQFILVKENGTYCIDNCENNKFIYINEEEEQYCYDNCKNNQFIYIGEHNEKYCYDKCKITQFISERENGTYCIDNCENNKFIYINEEEEQYCYDNCKNNQFIYELVNKQYCIDNCNIDNFFINENGNKSCNNKSDINEKNESDYKNNNNDYDIIIRGDDNMLSKLFENLDNNQIIINNDNPGTTFQIFKYGLDLNNINSSYSNSTIIDLRECEKRIYEYYGLIENENLYITSEVYQTKDPNKATNDFIFNVYLKNGTRIKDFSMCKDTPISISVPITNEEIMKLNLAKEFYKLGYDIYNLSSNFYNDKCTPSNINNSDIIISDRIKDVYPSNVTICPNNCTLDIVKIESKRANCICNISIPIESNSNDNIVSNIDTNKILNSFIDISMVNFDILKCNELLLTKDGLLYNIGSYIILFIFVIYIINIISFYIKEYKLYFNNIKLIIESGKKKIKNENSNIINNNKNMKFGRNNKKNLKTVLSNEIELIDKKIGSNNNILVIHKKNSKKKQKKKNILVYKKSNKNRKDNKKIIYNNSNENNSTSQKRFSYISLNDMNKKNDKKLNDYKMDLKKLLDFNDYELNNLNYKKALLNDKRTFKQYYWSLLKQKHLILFSFIPSNDYNSFIIKNSLFYFIFSLNLTVNALFFNDSTMHKIYEDKGKYDFIYQMPQIIYSTLITTLINIFIKFLALSEKNVIQIKKLFNKKKSENLETRINEIIKCIKIKFIMFFIISFFLLTFFWYYLACFCALYNKTQIHLIKDTISSFLLSLILPILLNLLPVILRIKSLENRNSEKVYKISKFIQILL